MGSAAVDPRSTSTAPIGGREGPARHAWRSVALRERRDLGLLQIRGNLDAAAGDRLSTVLGGALSGGFPTSPPGPARIVRTRQDHWCIVLPRPSCQAALDALREALEATSALVSDFSPGAAWVRIEGEAAAEVLSAGCALDLHPAVFAPGSASWTRFERLRVLLIREAADVFDVQVDASCGRYFWSRLSEVAEGVDLLRA